MASQGDHHSPFLAGAQCFIAIARAPPLGPAYTGNSLPPAFATNTAWQLLLLQKQHLKDTSPSQVYILKIAITNTGKNWGTC